MCGGGGLHTLHGMRFSLGMVWCVSVGGGGVTYPSWHEVLYGSWYGVCVWGGLHTFHGMRFCMGYGMVCGGGGLHTLHGMRFSLGYGMVCICGGGYIPFMA